MRMAALFNRFPRVFEPKNGLEPLSRHRKRPLLGKTPQRDMIHSMLDNTKTLIIIGSTGFDPQFQPFPSS